MPRVRVDTWQTTNGDGLRNPVDLWLTGSDKYHRKARRKISAPSEVLPCWRAGIEAEVNNPAIRDALWFGLYTGMRRDEVLTLRWERVDMDALTFLVEETKTGVPLELPIPNAVSRASSRNRRRTTACTRPGPTSPGTRLRRTVRQAGGGGGLEEDERKGAREEDSASGHSEPSSSTRNHRRPSWPSERTSRN